MLRFDSIGHVLGQFLLFLAVAMTLPILYGLLSSSGPLLPLLISLFICVAAGGLLTFLLPRPTREFRPREALLLVTVTWVFVTLFGSLPLYFSPEFPSFSDAFFEAASGFSASGATVLGDVEQLGKPILFWRCLTHWFGGMGIILLGVAVLPLLGHGGASLYRAEFSGSGSEKLKPRVTQTALALWKVYLGLSIASYLALRWAGMGNFDALCHTFSVMGTGGFSSRSASVASFQNPTVEYTIIVFMFLGGVSMILHYRLWLEHRPLAVLANAQLRAYASILLIAGIVATVLLRFYNGYAWEPALRAGFFQVTSITTTSGLVTDDFELWHPLGQMLLLGLMFVGGCTGSTSGGLKVARLLLLTKVIDRELKRMVERHGVRSSSRLARHPGVDDSELAEPGLHCRRRHLVGIAIAGLDGCGPLDVTHRGYCGGIQHRPRVWRSRAGRKLRLDACRSQMGLEFLHDCRPPRVLLRARSADAWVLAKVAELADAQVHSAAPSILEKAALVRSTRR